MSKHYLDVLTREERRLLETHHFDLESFDRLRARYRRGDWTSESNRLQGLVEHPREGDIKKLAGKETKEGRRLGELGRRALEAGEVGALVLNGGMATRFGGVVKGCVEVFEEQCFLGLKLRDAARWNAPVLLMNSFATDEHTRKHLEERDYYGFPKERLVSYVQNISVRLTPEGEVFRTEEGETLYAPGHGDVADATRRGGLEAFRKMGGKYLLMSNVDNVLARLDPVVVGAHIDAAQRRGVEMSAEVVDNFGSCVGGMPARVEGSLQIVEAFRFPKGFDVSAIPVYNTNTFLFNAEALEREFELTWFVVEKEVGGKTAVQFERLAGQISAFLKSQFIQVPRQGAASRFLPIKERSDLEENREFLAEALKARGGI